MNWKEEIKKEEGKDSKNPSATAKAFDLVNEIQQKSSHIEGQIKELNEAIWRLRGMLIML